VVAAEQTIIGILHLVAACLLPPAVLRQTVVGLTTIGTVLPVVVSNRPFVHHLPLAAADRIGIGIQPVVSVDNLLPAPLLRTVVGLTTIGIHRPVVVCPLQPVQHLPLVAEQITIGMIQLVLAEHPVLPQPPVIHLPPVAAAIIIGIPLTAAANPTQPVQLHRAVVE